MSARANKPWVITCPVCHVQGVPERGFRDGKPRDRVLHATRVVPCRPKEGTDGAQILAERLDELWTGQFPTNGVSTGTDESGRPFIQEIKVGQMDESYEGFIRAESEAWLGIRTSPDSH